MRRWARALAAGWALAGCAGAPRPGPAPPGAVVAPPVKAQQPASSLDAATRLAEEKLRELRTRAEVRDPAAGGDGLRERYEELLLRPGTPEDRKPEILLRLAELAYREEEAALKSAYESDEGPRALPEERHAESIGFYTRLVEAYPKSPQALTAFYNLGYLFAETGRGARSAWAYREVLARDPSSPYADEIHMRLGETAFDAGALDEAAEHYRIVVRSGKPEYADKALYKLGWCFFNQERYGHAVEALSTILSLGRPSPEDLRQETLEVLAKSLVEAGGLAALRAQVARDPGVASYAAPLHRLMGDLYAESSRYREAAEAYAAGVETRPTSPEALALERGVLSALLLLRDHEAANARRESWVDRYGRGTEWDTVHGSGPLGRERDLLLEEGLRLAALHHHGRSQRGQGGLDKAIELYGRYLKLYGSSTEEGYEIAFARAQELKEAGRLSEAAAQYGRVAADSNRGSHREDASYRRIAVLRVLYDQDPAALDDLATAHEDYVTLNPGSPLVPEILFGRGELLMGAERLDGARTAFERVVRGHGSHPLAAEALERIARCHFREGSYADAESSVRRALGAPLSEATAKSARELLAFSIFRQAEAREAEGDREGANREFLRLAEELPGGEAAQIAVYRAAENLRALGRQAEAAQTYERLAKTYRGSRYAREALGLSAELFAAQGNWGQAARNYEELYRAGPSDPEAPDALFRAGTARERAREPAEAVRAFEEFCERFPDDPRAAEARFRQGEALRVLGREREASERYREAWATAAPAGASAYRAKAALALARMALVRFEDVRLEGDLEDALARKEGLLEESLAHLAQAASLPFAETFTEALFRAGESFEHLKDALLSSERPAELSEEEREEYDFLLEEKAFPLEERAVAYYRDGVAAAQKAGVHTAWVDRMYGRLETLVPWAYQRKEEPSLAWETPGVLEGSRMIGAEAKR